MTSCRGLSLFVSLFDLVGQMGTVDDVDGKPSQLVFRALGCLHSVLTFCLAAPSAKQKANRTNSVCSQTFKIFQHITPPKLCRLLGIPDF